MNLLFRPPTFRPCLALALSTLAGLVGLGLAALWLCRWPTRGQSIFFAVTSSTSVAASCLWETEPVVALMACSGLAVSGGYIALFHTAPYLSMNFCLAATVGAAEVARLTASGKEVLALSCYFLVLELNVAVPFAIQVVVRTLGADLLGANRDPLTGLLNRRACERAVIGRMLGAARHMFLVVAMVDLDRFKELNDSRGHAAGDEALLIVARALVSVCTDTAVIGRVGGEEFLIADIGTTQRPPQWAQRLCDAVRAITPPVTASVGTALLALPSNGSYDADHAYRQLIAYADIAMYEAKRRGGNQVRHDPVVHPVGH